MRGAKANEARVEATVALPIGPSTQVSIFLGQFRFLLPLPVTNIIYLFIYLFIYFILPLPVYYCSCYQ